ncbi:O-antigen ligase family protein [Undibacterium arcticum]
MLGATTVIVMAAVALTFSRGAYLGLFFCGRVFSFFTQRRFRAMLVVLLLVTLAALFMPDAVVERASMGLGNGNVEDVSAGRVDEIWRPLIPEILSNPLIGHGLGSILWSESAQHRAILPVGHPHSAYLGVLLDFGVLGAIVIFVFFRHMWRLFIDLAKRMPDPIWRAYFRGAAACILLLLVQGVTDDSFTPTRTQPFLWLSYGIATGFFGRDEKPRNQTKLNSAWHTIFFIAKKMKNLLSWARESTGSGPGIQPAWYRGRAGPANAAGQGSGTARSCCQHGGVRLWAG